MIVFRYIVTAVQPDDTWLDWSAKKYINQQGGVEDVFVIKDNDTPVNELVPIIRQFTNNVAFMQWFHLHGSYNYEEIIPL